ncbi:MFS transporter [Priestia filamentosa]|uniref:MFS transporter n=1 Tax=Priestia filamentosa TaxID=1402861 RepID=UPI000E74A664|nr:MFS transporter [Priestia filamentosa]RJS64501.1 MFS transporter [Priestia filamentosa]
MEKRQIKLVNYLAYGSTDFLGAGAFALTAAWLLYFYTTFCGLTPVQAGSIFAIARFVDAIAAPVMGYITDNFHKTKLGKKFGRRRFFLLISIPLVLCYSLIWVSGMSYWYYLLTYIAFEIVYTMVLIPYETLASEMTTDFKKRAKFTGARMFTAQLSAVFAAFIPGRLVEALGKDDPMTFLYAGTIFTVIFVCVLTFVYKFTWERPLEDILNEEVQEEKIPFFKSVKKVYIDLISTLRVRAFRQHLGMYLGAYLSQDIFNAVFTYFIVFSLAQDTVVASNLMTVMYLLQIFGVWLAMTMTLKLNPAPAYRVAISLFMVGVIGYVVVYYANPSNLMLMLFILIGIAGLGRGGLNFIPWNIYPFIPDVDEVLTGQRREGVFAGMMTFIRKASQALAVFLVSFVLQEAGFVSGKDVQSASALTAIIAILTIGTLIFLVGGFLISYRYKLTKENHTILLNEISRLKSGGSMSHVDTTTRKVVEQLSGWQYEKLWGNNPVGYKNKITYKNLQDKKKSKTS